MARSSSPASHTPPGPCSVGTTASARDYPLFVQSGASRLLPQPGGFEGLFTARILTAACDLSVADREDGPQGRIRLDSAEPGTSAVLLSYYHPVLTSGDQFHQLHPEPVEHVDPVLEPGPQGVFAMDRTAVVGSTLH